MPEWMFLSIGPFAFAVAFGSIICFRERRMSKSTLVDVLLVFGGIFVIGFNKEVAAPAVRNFITEYLDHFFLCPVCIGAGNLMLVALRHTPWRSFDRCLAVSLGIGLFLEFGYPYLSMHIGGDWFDVGVYVAGGLVPAVTYKIFKV